MPYWEREMNQEKHDFLWTSAPATIVFWAIALCLLFWALGDRGLWTSEGRWAELTREMFLSGDFFHPTINGEPYFDKPLLTYWLIGLVSALAGSLNEWTVRLPSALSGLLSLWATVHLGRTLWSKETGRTAGWILLSTYGFLFWARTGTAEMENLAAIVLAVAWYWQRREKKNFCTFFVFYLICFLGAHTKGLTALVVPIAAVLPDLIRGRRWRSLCTGSHVAALTIGIAIYLAPFVYANFTQGTYQESGLALAFRENFQRYFHAFDHRGPFYLYCYYLPILFLPWSPLLLAALFRTSAMLTGLDEKTRWLAEAILLIFVFFTASGSRRGYYILPILPFCALLTSVFIVEQGESVCRRVSVHIQWGVLVLASLALVFAPAIPALWVQHTGFVVPAGLRHAALAVGLIALTPWFVAKKYPRLLGSISGCSSRAAPLVATAAVLMGGFFCWEQGTLELYRTEKVFAQNLQAQTAGIQPSEIAFYRKVAPNVLFYLDLPGHVSVLSTREDALEFITPGRDAKVLIANRAYRNDLFRLLPDASLGPPTWAEKSYPWERHCHKLEAWKVGPLN